MAMTTYASIAAYIAAQPKAAQGPLKKVRSAIRKAIPKAKESLSYKIPTYKIDDKVVLYFAGWAKHYSLYPCGPEAGCEVQEGTGAVRDQQGDDPVSALRGRAGETDCRDREVPRRGKLASARR